MNPSQCAIEVCDQLDTNVSPSTLTFRIYDIFPGITDFYDWSMEETFSSSPIHWMCDYIKVSCDAGLDGKGEALRRLQALTVESQDISFSMGVHQ